MQGERAEEVNWGMARRRKWWLKEDVLKHSGIQQMWGKLKTSLQLFHTFHSTSSKKFL